MFFDTHCHLDFAVFDSGRDQLMRQAKTKGINNMLVPGVQLADFPKIIQLQQQWPSQIAVALGLHPCFLHCHPENAIAELTQQLHQYSKVCALGEIGLDAREGMAAEVVQVMLLEAQLKLARQMELPVILHVVKAHDRMLSLLRRYALPKGGVVHAFSGSLEQAKHYAKLGFKLGFGGAITYARAQKQHRLVRELPLEWILLETDAPDMPLAGYQDQPNSPLMVVNVAEAIAMQRELSLSAVAEQTRCNGFELFGLN